MLLLCLYQWTKCLNREWISAHYYLYYWIVSTLSGVNSWSTGISAPQHGSALGQGPFPVSSKDRLYQGQIIYLLPGEGLSHIVISSDMICQRPGHGFIMFISIKRCSPYVCIVACPWRQTAYATNLSMSPLCKIKLLLCLGRRNRYCTEILTKYFRPYRQ